MPNSSSNKIKKPNYLKQCSSEINFLKNLNTESYNFQNLSSAIHDYISNNKPCINIPINNNLTTYSTTEENCSGICGDTNNSGDTNVLDVVTLVNVIVGTVDISNCPLQYDYNKDGVLNILDVVQLVNHILSTDSQTHTQCGNEFFPEVTMMSTTTRGTCRCRHQNHGGGCEGLRWTDYGQGGSWRWQSDDDLSGYTTSTCIRYDNETCIDVCDHQFGPQTGFTALDSRAVKCADGSIHAVYCSNNDPNIIGATGCDICQIWDPEFGAVNNHDDCLPMSAGFHYDDDLAGHSQFTITGHMICDGHYANYPGTSMFAGNEGYVGCGPCDDWGIWNHLNENGYDTSTDGEDYKRMCQGEGFFGAFYTDDWSTGYPPGQLGPWDRDDSRANCYHDDNAHYFENNAGGNGLDINISNYRYEAAPEYCPHEDCLCCKDCDNDGWADKIGGNGMPTWSEEGYPYIATEHCKYLTGWDPIESSLPDGNWDKCNFCNPNIIDTDDGGNIVRGGCIRPIDGAKWMPVVTPSADAPEIKIGCVWDDDTEHPGFIDHCLCKNFYLQDDPPQSCDIPTLTATNPCSSPGCSELKTAVASNSCCGAWTDCYDEGCDTWSNYNFPNIAFNCADAPTAYDCKKSQWGGWGCRWCPGPNGDEDGGKCVCDGQSCGNTACTSSNMIGGGFDSDDFCWDEIANPPLSDETLCFDPISCNYNGKPANSFECSINGEFYDSIHSCWSSCGGAPPTGTGPENCVSAASLYQFSDYCDYPTNCAEEVGCGAFTCSNGYTIHASYQNQYQYDCSELLCDACNLANSSNICNYNPECDEMLSDYSYDRCHWSTNGECEECEPLYGCWNMYAACNNNHDESGTYHPNGCPDGYICYNNDNICQYPVPCSHGGGTYCPGDPNSNPCKCLSGQESMAATWPNIHPQLLNDFYGNMMWCSPHTECGTGGNNGYCNTGGEDCTELCYPIFSTYAINNYLGSACGNNPNPFGDCITDPTTVAKYCTAGCDYYVDWNTSEYMEESATCRLSQAAGNLTDMYVCRGNGILDDANNAWSNTYYGHGTEIVRREVEISISEGCKYSGGITSSDDWKCGAGVGGTNEYGIFWNFNPVAVARNMTDYEYLPSQGRYHGHCVHPVRGNLPMCSNEFLWSCTQTNCENPSFNDYFGGSTCYCDPCGYQDDYYWGNNGYCYDLGKNVGNPDYESWCGGTCGCDNSHACYNSDNSSCMDACYECTDTDDGTSDSGGGSCDDYWGNEWQCGYYDCNIQDIMNSNNDDCYQQTPFLASSMCCACGGGSTTPTGTTPGDDNKGQIYNPYHEDRVKRIISKMSHDDMMHLQNKEKKKFVSKRTKRKGNRRK